MSAPFSLSARRNLQVQTVNCVEHCSWTELDDPNEEQTRMKLGLPAHDVQPGASGKLIPDGSFVKVTMAIRPGGVDGSSEVDRGLLRASNIPSSDVLSLDCELTVVEGPFAKCTFRQLFTVPGGTVNDKGGSIGRSISQRIFRAMLDSALGLDPEDTSEAAKAKRQLRGLCDLDGITFVAKVAVEPSNDARYADHNNRLDYPVPPTDKEWRAVMNGEAVPPRPLTRPGYKTTTARVPAPAAVTASATAGSSTSALRPSAPPAAPPAHPKKPAGPAWLIG